MFRFLLGTQVWLEMHREGFPSKVLCCTGLNLFNGSSDTSVGNEPGNQAEAESRSGRDGVEDSTGHSDLLLGQDWEFVCGLLYGVAVGVWKWGREEFVSGFALIM